MFELIGRAYAVSFSDPGLTFLNVGITPTSLIGRILTWVLFFAGAIAVIYLVYGGLLYITAGGDAEKATKGRTAVINAIIGIVIILLALVIVSWVSGIVSNSLSK